MSGATGNAPAQQRLRTREKDRRRRFEASLRAVVGSAEGRLVVRWLLGADVSNLLGPTFGVSAESTTWREGRRSVGIAILQALERVEPGAYARLAVEDAAELAEEMVHKRDAEAQAPEE